MENSAIIRIYIIYMEDSTIIVNLIGWKIVGVWHNCSKFDMHIPEIADDYDANGNWLDIIIAIILFEC